MSTSIALNVLEILCLYRQYRHACIFGMVRKLWFSAVQNFFRIENPLDINKVMDRNVCTCLYQPYRHSIALNALEILCLYQLYRHACIVDMVRKLRFSAVQNFFRIENPLNINKVMDRNVCTCLYRQYQHSIT